MAPVTKTYSVQNTGAADLPWEAKLTSTWARVMGPSSGTLSPGETADVLVDIDTIAAGTLTPGTFSEKLEFTNTGNGTVLEERDVVLTVTKTVNGWTPLTPSVGTRIIYVSESDGVDTASYNYHVVGDPEVGADPFDPVGSVYEYKSLAAAHAQLRDGEADWLLLKRGDTWTESFPTWEESGADSTRPMLVSAYGTGARPRVMGFDTKDGPNHPDSTFDYLSIVSIEFYEDGIDRLIGGDGWLVEDCLFSKAPNSAVIIQAAGATPLTNVAIRRCIFVDRYPDNGGKTQGLFARDVQGLLIEECVFDHNGWDESIPGAEATIYNHNVYIQKTCSDVTFRGNISANAASHGCQQRTDGLVDDNLFLRNPINLLIGSNTISSAEWPETYAGSGIVRNNVCLDSRDITATTLRGNGIWAQMTDALDVYGNIVAHQESGTGACVGIKLDLNNRDLEVFDNVVYDWSVPGVPSKGIGIKVQDALSGATAIYSNSIQQVTWGDVVDHEAGFSACEYKANVYFSTDAGTNWFSPGNSFDEWIEQSGETEAVVWQVPYPDPDRDVESYMADVLGLTPSVDAFLAEARLQSKTNWRPEFTAAAVNGYIRKGFGLSRSF